MALDESISLSVGKPVAFEALKLTQLTQALRHEEAIILCSIFFLLQRLTKKYSR